MNNVVNDSDLEASVESKLDAQLQQWQRLSPWSIVYFIARTFKGGLDPNILVFLAPLYGLYHLIEDKALSAIVLSIAIPLLILTLAIVKYVFFKYRVKDETFHIVKGVLFRNRIDIPFSRIQDVQIEAPYYFRAMGLVSAAIDTAGSNVSEVVLAAITNETAIELREWVFQKDKLASVSGKGDSIESIDDNVVAPRSALSEHSTGLNEVLLMRSVKDLLIHGVSNNRVWILIAALLPLVDAVMGQSIDKVVALNSMEFFQLEGASALHLSAVFVAAIIVLIAVTVMLSILGSFVSLHGYCLTRSDETLSRESGLFSRRQVNLKFSRLQYVSIQQGVMDRLFDRFNLFFEQVSSHRQNPQEKSTRFLVPSVTSEEVECLCSEVYSNIALDLSAFKRTLKGVNVRYFRQQVLLTTLPLSAILLIALVIATEDSYLLAFFPLVLVLGCWLNFLSWKKCGYACIGEYLLVRRGLFGTTYTLFPQYKLQQVALHQSLPMRYSGYCTLRFLLGTVAVGIPYIPLKEGIVLADSSMYHLEASGRSWM